MEMFQEELLAGKRSLQAADHLVSMTYQLVGDPKLLLAAAENLLDAGKKLIASLLHYEAAFKRIPHFREDYDSMIYWFRTRCVPKYKLGINICISMAEIKALLENHKSSPVVFPRNGSLVICSDNYSISKLTVSQLKDYVSVFKRMLFQIEEVVLGYEGIFGRRKGRIEAR